MLKQGGLGRGLGSLIPNKKYVKEAIKQENRDILIDDDPKRILDIPVDTIEVNPHQPRQIFDHEGLEELIESIKVHGIIQPLIVTKVDDGYQLIAGERRLRSAKVIGLDRVPAIVREVDEQQKLEIALIENLQRRNLNAIEKAVAYERLMDEFSLNQEQVGEKLGISRSTVANTIRFLDLPGEVQRALGNEQITEGHAKVIAGLDSEKEQLDFLKKILQYNFTVRDAEKEIRRNRPQKSKKVGVRLPKSAELESKEELLRGSLNTKVNINEKGGKGQIVVEFYSQEEMNSIIDDIIN
jgi:ParB family transcriptional regulator, chromosome partitioning protein